MSHVLTLLIFLSILLVCGILLYTAAAKIQLFIGSDDNPINLSVRWLYPLFAADVITKGNKPKLEISIFHFKLYSKPIKRKQKTKQPNHRKLLHFSDLKELQVEAIYGFANPAVTGIACASLGAAMAMTDAGNIRLYPDFTASQDYLILDATAKVNLAQVLIGRLFSRANHSVGG